MQLELFPAPASKGRASDRRILAAMLRRAAMPALVGSTGMTRREIRILMRPLPRITIPH